METKENNGKCETPKKESKLYKIGFIIAVILLVFFVFSSIVVNAKATCGMRQTGSAVDELLNRKNVIRDDFMNNIMNNNVIGGSEGYSRQQVNPAAIGQHVSL